MAVAFDAQSSAVTTANAATSFTNSTRLTVGSGANRALLVMIQWSTSTAPTGVSITWNGVALTLIPGTSKSNGLDCNVAIYGLVNPASGTLALAGSWTGSKDYSVVGVAYTGVDQRGGATSFPNGNTAGATSTSASVTITSATGNAVVGTIASDDVLSAFSGTTIFNGGQTSLTYDAGANRNVGAATVAVSCTVASASPWAAAGCDILAAAVVFDAKSTADTAGAAATSFSVATLTVGADPNRALTVLMGWGGSSAPTGVSITWGGVALTLVGNTSVANTNGNVAIYALLNPASGAQTLAGSWTGAQDFYMEAVSWSGVDQTSIAVAFPNGNTSTGSGTALSLTVNSAVGNATVSIDVGKNNSGTNNQTLLFFDNVNTTDAMGQWAPGASSVTFSSTAAAGAWAMGGCDILLASVGVAGAVVALVAPLTGLPAHHKFAVPRGPFDLLFSPMPSPMPGAPYRAVSLRQLTVYCPNYFGSCLQVKRSSDNATQNIGFVNGFLDTATMLSFVGANTGVVSIWYDQSGNARNWTGSSGQEPTIVSSGTLITMGGQPAIRSVSTQNFTSAFGTCIAPYTTLAVWSVDDAITQTNFGVVLISGHPATNSYLYGLNNPSRTSQGQQSIAVDNIFDIGAGVAVVPSGRSFAGGIGHTGTNWSIYFNGVLDNGGADTSVFQNTGGAQIFSQDGSTQWNAGTCQELIEWGISLGDPTAGSFSLEQYRYFVPVLTPYNPWPQAGPILAT